jgi:hypothetical protein
MGMDELVDQWTVLDDELKLVARKRGGARLAIGTRAPAGADW